MKMLKNYFMNYIFKTVRIDLRRSNESLKYYPNRYLIENSHCKRSRDFINSKLVLLNDGYILMVRYGQQDHTIPNLIYKHYYSDFNGSDIVQGFRNH